MNQIKIGNRIISSNHSPFVIAEAGINHNGSLTLAKKLVDMAKKAGAELFQNSNSHNRRRND